MKKRALSSRNALVTIIASLLSIVAGLLFGYILLLIFNKNFAGFGIMRILTTGFSSLEKLGKVLDGMQTEQGVHP